MKKAFVILMLILQVFCLQQAFAQQTEIKKTKRHHREIDTLLLKHPQSFRCFTELGHWACVMPNIGFEYRLNKRWAVNLSGSYRTFGIEWPMVLTMDHFIYMEQWTASGFDIMPGFKIYPWLNNKYFAFRLYFCNQSFPVQNVSGADGDESAYIYTCEKMNEYDLGCLFLYGIEGKRANHYFGSFYFGFGFKCEFTKRVIFGQCYYHDIIDNYPLDKNDYTFYPMFHIGYNIGTKTVKCINPDKKSCRFDKIPSNSVYISIFGLLNYERIICRVYPCFLSAQLGLERSMLNAAIQFSNRMNYEAGFGSYYWDMFSLFHNSFWQHLYFPVWWFKLACLRYTAPFGLMAKAEISKLWSRDFKTRMGLCFDIGIGYSFGKRK